MSRRVALALTVLAAALAAAPAAHAAVALRLKDLARIRDVRPNHLFGIGIVVGLNATGDDEKLSSQLVGNMLQRLHVSIPVNDIKSKNVAAVMVTAEIPAFMSEGSKLDVLISALGGATSLEGGTLLQTPLQGADGAVYAVAQGPLSTGGFSVAGEAAKVKKNHPTVGRIPGGAIIERKIHTVIRPGDDVQLILNTPDFATAVRAAEAITKAAATSARAMNAAVIEVRVPEEFRVADQLPIFLARVQDVRVTPDAPARVVVNERTGTIVAGEHVKLSAAALSHGSLTIAIRESTRTSQPNAFAKGETRSEKSTEISATESKPGVFVFDDAATLAEVARALNVLGVSPRDMVAIFQALREVGALQCELVII
jgi:flagellar P-ring protein precursor FlgI